MDIHSNKISNSPGKIKPPGPYTSPTIDDVKLPVDSLVQTANISGHDVSKITILHTNDIHGHMDPQISDGFERGGIANLGATISRERDENPGGTLVLDGGDISSGGPVSDHFKTIPMVETMNQIGYDAMVIGNHEMDYGIDAFTDVTRKAEFPILSANTRYLDDESVSPRIQPYVIKEVSGKKIGILGLTTPDTKELIPLADKDRVEFYDARETALQTIPLMKEEGAELVVVLSHMGIDRDRELAQNVPGIDVIIGGHSHTDMESHEVINNTAIHQAGKFGRSLGRLDISLKTGDGGAKVVDVQSRNIPVTCKLEPDRQVMSIFKSYSGRLENTFNRVIGRSMVDLDQRDPRQWKEESRLANFITDTMRNYMKADICLLSPAGFRSNIYRGKVKAGQINQLFPFEDNMTAIDLKGKDIKTAMDALISGPAKGLAVSGLRVVIDTTKPAGQRVENVFTADGKPLEDDKTYRVATRGSFANGILGLDVLTRHENRRDSAGSFRDILTERFEKGGPAYSTLDGRIVNLDLRPEHTLS